jgi:hypothetical protein
VIRALKDRRVGVGNVDNGEPVPAEGCLISLIFSLKPIFDGVCISPPRLFRINISAPATESILGFSSVAESFN